jgi:hypothetical protein
MNQQPTPAAKAIQAQGCRHDPDHLAFYPARVDAIED